MAEKDEIGYEQPLPRKRKSPPLHLINRGEEGSLR
jgi:hypothetical protein